MRRLIYSFGILLSSCTYEHVEKATNQCTNSTLALTVVTVNASSCSAKDGSLTATAEGGSESYSYSLDDGTYQSSPLFENLAGGNYTVTVKDSLGCTASTVASINNDGSSLKITLSTTIDTGCPTSNGTITVNVSGATDPVQYKLNSNSFQSANTFSSLKAGTYSITVVDATNCQASASATITRNGPSFASTISPIISTYCATSGCHNGSRSPTLTTYASIKANGSSIVSAINRNMPPNGNLSSSQINAITCWVNDGAPNN